MIYLICKLARIYLYRVALGIPMVRNSAEIFSFIIPFCCQNCLKNLQHFAFEFKYIFVYLNLSSYCSLI